MILIDLIILGIDLFLKYKEYKKSNIQRFDVFDFERPVEELDN